MGKGFGLDRVSTLRAIKGGAYDGQMAPGVMHVERGRPTPMHLALVSLPPRRTSD